MLDQRLTDPATVDHVEHPGRHGTALSGSDDRLGHPLGRGHVAAVGLEHHRAAGGQRRSGVATGRGKRQGEVAGAEHCDRPQAHAALADIQARQRGTLGLRTVDARAEEVTAAQHRGEQPQLAAGARPLTLDTGGRQGRFLAYGRDEVVTQGIEGIGDGVEKLGAASGGQGPVNGVGSCSGQGSGIDFFVAGLVERAWQSLPAACIDTAQGRLTGGAANPADELLACVGRHG